MDRIEKLLSKISKKDRRRLLYIVEVLVSGNKKGMDIVKIKNSDFFRLRSGRFRIIFHYEDITRDIVIDSIKLRNEKTYK